MTYLSHRRKGGIHFFSVGPYRLTLCKAKAVRHFKLPKATPFSVFQLEADIAAEVAQLQAHRLRTWTDAEHNRFIF